MSESTYLGEFPLGERTDDPLDYAMVFIEKYGASEGDHHKAWVIDQVVRILKGTPVIVTEARWTDHDPEVRYRTGEPSAEYLVWVAEMREEDEEDWSDGTAP
jgi:hypothetical protein